MALTRFWPNSKMADALKMTVLRKQLQLEKYGTHLSGFIVAAHTPSYAQEASLPLPFDLRELKLQLSEAFGLQLASVQMRTWCAVSAGAPVDNALWAELSSQDDLVAVMEELTEAGMHQLYVEVRGRSSVRTLEALSGALGLVSTAAWLLWIFLLAISVPASEWVIPSAIVALAALVANGLVAAAAVVCGGSELSAWLKRHWPLVLLTPLTSEALLLVSSGACGCAARLPSRTRRALLLWGSVAQLGGRGAALYMLQAAMVDSEVAAAFSAAGVISALQCPPHVETRRLAPAGLVALAPAPRLAPLPLHVHPPAHLLAGAEG